MLIGIVVSNIVIMVGGLIHLTNRLTKIETHLWWIKRNCPQCQQTSENLLQ